MRFTLPPAGWLPAAVILLTIAGPGTSQTLPEVVVTATRVERPIAESLVDISVIDAAEIARFGAATLPELLRARAGVEISQNGGAGAVSGIFLRGSKTSQTLILVDGIRLENPTSGGGNLEFLPLSVIDRIEIVRGPSSALYGSSAIGGVIQIFTRSGAAPGSHAMAGFGSNGSSQLQAGFSQMFNEARTRLSVSASSERTRGFEATRPGTADYQADRDGHRRLALTAGLAHQLGKDWQLAANLIATDGRTEYDDAFSTPRSARLSYRTTALSVSARGRVAEGWTTELRAGQSAIDYSYQAFDFAPRTHSETLLWINSLTLPAGRLDLGVEQLRQRIAGEGLSEGDSPYARTSRRTDSVFAAYELAVQTHRLRLQLRQDRIQSVGSEPTAAIGWGWQWAPAWTVRASWASSFRAPTFDDLYNPFGANPSLRAERGRGAELALEHRPGAGGLMRIVAFDNRIRDAIEIDADFLPRNLLRAHVKGVSLEWQRRWAGIQWQSSLTVQDAQGVRVDADTAADSRRLARRARAFGMLAAQWQQGPLRTTAQWIAQGDRVDTRGEKLAGYGIVDLTAAWALSTQWELFGRLGNLGNRAYETVSGYNMPGRTLFVGVRYAGR
ncbi:MAG TPA: TonB-dependent receptor [Burkholderiaceae bacterium]|jgi:vitamin B12 transporter|nr:TonB-dependent receptor [Burkholderiaceae bacterium]